jgi:hypothetical protein
MIIPRGPISPVGSLIIGVVLLLLGSVSLIGAIFQPRFLMRIEWLHLRWGKSGKGPPVSRFGVAASGIFCIAMGSAAILNGCLRVMPKHQVIPLLLTTFLIFFCAGLFDTWRAGRKRR